eukprot:GHVS01039915.1.p1 GENE.GHVS01039915.1~~GHVS01039915.1.p1  ORF type:complete len:218 (+),score=9.27 GHVS01039915.1:49-702(+)
MANFWRYLPPGVSLRHRKGQMVNVTYNKLSHNCYRRLTSDAGRMELRGIVFKASRFPRKLSWHDVRASTAEVAQLNRSISSNASHNDFETHPAEEIKWKDVEEKIKELLASRRVVLFMKGTPDNPECGFSAKVVTLMKLAGIGDHYTFVNVLAHPVIREGIKRYSDWPTVPQLYVDGEFIGGCDVISDLFESKHLHYLLSLATNPEHRPSDTLPSTQ